MLQELVILNILLSCFILGETAISILNMINEEVFHLGVEHFYFNNCYEDLCNLNNLIFASRIKDLTSSYKKGIIDIEQLDNYIKRGNLSSSEIIYLYASKDLYLNKKFVTIYIISNILSDLDISVFSLEPDFVSEFYTLLLYNFKFRNYTAQSLELTIKGFQTGCTIERQK